MNDLRWPPEPVDLGILRGDRMYAYANSGRTSFFVRDWRQSAQSHQWNMTEKMVGPYLDKRRENVAVNRVKDAKTIYSLKGEYAGRTMYFVGSGPSVLRNFREHPPMVGDVVVAVNRGFVLCPYPVDFLLIGDGVVTPSMMEGWREQFGKLGIPTYVHSSSSLLLNQWGNPEMRECWGPERTYFWRQDGIGHEHQYTRVNMSIPGLDCTYYTGSVAVHLADWMGCSQLVMVGMDMAKTDGYDYPGVRSVILPGRAYRLHPDLVGDWWTVTEWQAMLAARKLEAMAFIASKYGMVTVNLTGRGIIGQHIRRERIDAGREKPPRHADEIGKTSEISPRRGFALERRAEAEIESRA